MLNTYEHQSPILEDVTDLGFLLSRCVLLDWLFNQLIALKAYYCYKLLVSPVKTCAFVVKKRQTKTKVRELTVREKHAVLKLRKKRENQSEPIQQIGMSLKRKKPLVH